MKQQKQITLLSWLVWLPIKFALISFLSFILTRFIYTFILSLFPFTNNFDNIILSILLTIAFILSIFFTFRKQTTQKIDRYDFVALTNVQTTVLGFAFLISTLFLITNANNILLKLLWLETHSSITFFTIIVSAAIFYLYLCGLFLSNVLIKYNRCKTIGIDTWKIICSMPFGFSLLWIPGYILPDSSSKQANISMCNWYNQLNKRILSKPLNTYITFIIIVLLSGFFFGFRNILVTFVMLAIFTIWHKKSGKKNFQKDLNTKYSYFAVGINVVLLMALLTSLFIYLPNSKTNNNINMNIIETTEVIHAQ